MWLFRVSALLILNVTAGADGWRSESRDCHLGLDNHGVIAMEPIPRALPAQFNGVASSESSSDTALEFAQSHSPRVAATV